jgi:hypothetical protein
MWAAQAVILHAHNGKMLTRPEILIDQFHEMRLAAQKKLADEKMSEKIILSRISSKLITVPSVSVSVLCEGFIYDIHHTNNYRFLITFFESSSLD